MGNCSVILVTYNSEPFIQKAMDALLAQTVAPSHIVIVDTGSKERGYLEKYQACATLLFEKPQAGFCRGNNTGYQALFPRTKYVLLLNPDAFLTPCFIERAIAKMEEHPSCGALTGQTLGFDLANDRPSGFYDTTGIFSTWYGKWYDRDQGLPVGKALEPQKIPAICGALYFCRKKALDEVVIRGNEVFDSSFYMYKEDIDLSLRMRKKGWDLWFFPDLIAYHCRGWNPDRRKVPKSLRMCSAKNEWKLQLRQKHVPGLIYSSLKLLAVKMLNR